VNLNEVSRGGVKDAFGHVAAAGISGAENEDFGFVVHGNR
jgi:hypothetical protein